ncbi:MAG: uL30 family ribosomal protein [Candidatus Pacearchaeota archaeon]
MKAIIRIHGQVGLKKDIKETLNRLRLRKKYSCVILKESPVIMGMIKKVENFVAYGDIDKETFMELIKKRAKPIDKNKKIDFKQIIEEFFEKQNKKLEDLNAKPFFSLHPPRGGIKTKQKFPKGVLGNHKEKINELIMRML